MIHLRRLSVRAPASLAAALLGLVLTACEPAKPKPTVQPPQPKSTAGDTDRPKPGESDPDKPTPEPKPKRDPNDPFDLEDPKVLFEILAAEDLQGEAKLEVYRRYRLVDESGTPNVGRRRAWKQALTDFAEKHPDKWGEHYNAMERRRKARKSG